MSLTKLFSRCKKQDRQAQEELYNRFAAKFFTICLKYSNSYEEAKDNLQDGFVKIFENLDQFRGDGTFEGWMTRIMINTAIKKYRKNASVFLSIKEDLAEEPEVEIEENQFSTDDLIKMIQELPDRYRLVFNLYVMEEHSHQEIAEMLNISIGTSKSNLSRARMKLKEMIEVQKSQSTFAVKNEV